MFLILNFCIPIAFCKGWLKEFFLMLFFSSEIRILAKVSLFVQVHMYTTFLFLLVNQLSLEMVWGIWSLCSSLAF